MLITTKLNRMNMIKQFMMNSKDKNDAYSEVSMTTSTSKTLSIEISQILSTWIYSTKKKLT